MSASPLPEALRRHVALLLAAVGLLWVFPWVPALRSPNELCRLAQTRALVDFGTVEINEVLRRFGPVGDLSRMDERLPDGRTASHYFPSKAPLLSFMAVPVYAVLKAAAGGEPMRVGEMQLVYFARLFCTVLPALLCLFPVRRHLRRHLPEEVADALCVALGLGSLWYAYAELFLSHGLCAVLVFLTFSVLEQHRHGERGERAFALAGLLAGASVAAEYTAALALVPLALWGLQGARTDRRRALLLALVGVLPAVLFLGWYHWRCFGHPLETGYRHLNDPGYQGWHLGGFLGIRIPDPSAFWNSYFSPLRGFFVMQPFLLLAVPGLVWLFREPSQRPLAWLIAAEWALYTYFTSSFAYDSWGWTTGPRHMTPLVPFLLLPAGLAVVRLRERGAMWGGLAAALFGMSFVAMGLATQHDYLSDCLRNAVHRFVLPMLQSGHLPHSVASLLGVPNPWAWLPAGLALLGATALAFAASTGSRVGAVNLRGLAMGIALMALGIAVHRSIPAGPNTQCEDDTFNNLSRDHTPRPGEASVGFWR